MSNFTANDLFGCITALVTPMNKTGEVNYLQWSELIDQQIKAKVTAIVVAGTTGESSLLSESEFRQLLEIAVEKCENTETKVIAQTGTISPQKVIESNFLAHKLGADAVLCVTPYYIRTTQQGLIKHYLEIAEMSPLPVILYNVPSRTHNDLSPESTAHLAKHKNIIGLKEASTDPNRMQELSRLKIENFTVVSGNDDTFVEAMQNGAMGVISVASNVRAKTIVEICTLLSLGDEISANKLNSGLESLFKVLSYQPNPIPVKYLLHEAGLISDGIRMPLIWNEENIPYSKAEIVKIKRENS